MSRFELATVADDAELRAFESSVSMPGAIRLSSCREPDYFASVRVEGTPVEVIISRDDDTGRITGCGHRAIRQMSINGEPAIGGYLSGLRIRPSAQRGTLLARGYEFLRGLHADRQVPFYLTTIMEDNHQAKAALLGGRGGLPQYHDFGRFCCVAASLNQSNSAKRDATLLVRQATASDSAIIFAFWEQQRKARQFFPRYQPTDFGPLGLLPNLTWDDIFLAIRDGRLVGMLAAWDQRPFRQWRVAGYSPALRFARRPWNFLASLTKSPRLPAAGAVLSYFVLSLVCIQNDDRAVFAAVLDEVLRARRGQFDFFVAGLHERDPLLPELLARRYFPLTSRLYVAAWEDGAKRVAELDRGMVPYLEVGAL